MSKRVVLPFLLGALYSRITINQADHLLHGIRVQFPETKGWVPELLLRHFGGSIYRKHNKMGSSICYAIRSKEDLSRLYRALLKYYRDVPELAPFMALYRTKDALRIPGVEKLRLKRNRKKLRRNALRPSASEIRSPRRGRRRKPG